MYETKKSKPSFARLGPGMLPQIVRDFLLCDSVLSVTTEVWIE